MCQRRRRRRRRSSGPSAAGWDEAAPHEPTRHARRAVHQRHGTPHQPRGRIALGVGCRSLSLDDAPRSNRPDASGPGPGRPLHTGTAYHHGHAHGRYTHAPSPAGRVPSCRCRWPAFHRSPAGSGVTGFVDTTQRGAVAAKPKAAPGAHRKPLFRTMLRDQPTANDQPSPTSYRPTCSSASMSASLLSVWSVSTWMDPRRAWSGSARGVVGKGNPWRV